MKKAKNKILSALLFALLIVPCMLIVTACGEEHKAVEKWESDATYHWHNCSVKDCEEHTGEKAFNYGKHTYDETTHFCICGKAEHKATTNYGSDATQHWFTCQIKGCPEKFNIEAHTYDETTHVCSCDAVDPSVEAKIVTDNGDTATTTYYSTLKDAISGATAGATITLVKDIDLGTKEIAKTGNSVYYDITKSIILDFGGHTARGFSGIHVSGEGIEVVLKNGTLEAQANGLCVENKGKVTVESDFTIDANKKGWNNRTGILVKTNAKVHVKGTIFAPNLGVAGNGSVGNGGVEIIVEKTAKIVTPYAHNTTGNIYDNVAIYMPNSGTLTINGGEIKGGTALCVKCGDVTINGGTFESTCPKSDYVAYTNGWYCTGSAVVVDRASAKTKAYETNVNLTINGGKFKVATVKDGETPANLIEYYHLADTTKYNANISYGSNVSERAVEYVYTPKVGDAEPTVTPVVTYVSDSTELTSAIANTNVKTVVLTNNITLDTTSTGDDGHVVVSRKVTLDLNGYTLTGSGYDGVLKVVVGGDLTIDDSSKNHTGCVVAHGVWGDIIGGEGYCAIAVWARGGSVTIKGGNFSNTIADTSRRAYNDLIFASNGEDVNDGNSLTIGGHVFIYGGTFESVTSGWVLNINNSHRTQSSITVYGGEYKNFNPSEQKGYDTLTSEEVEAKVNRANGDTDTSCTVADGYTVNTVEENGIKIFTVTKTDETNTQLTGDNN